MCARDVLIATDPGLDDAVAILLALSHPGLDVRGVTTVAGNLGLAVTTRNAGRLLALAGRAGVPLHAGAAAPLERPGIDEAAIHGADGLGGAILPEPPAPAGGDAVGFLAQTLREAPEGSLDLLCLGPLTNLALLLAQAPDAARRVGRVVAMGGALEERGNAGPCSEFNLAHDPEAAARVLAAGLDLTLVPLDATRRVRADRAFLARLAAGPALARATGDLVAAYFEARTGTESRPLHDPLVPLLLLRPEAFRVEDRSLDVDLSEDPGALVPGPWAARVALAPDAPRLLDALARALGA